MSLCKSEAEEPELEERFRDRDNQGSIVEAQKMTRGGAHEPRRIGGFYNWKRQTIGLPKTPGERESLLNLDVWISRLQSSKITSLWHCKSLCLL